VVDAVRGHQDFVSGEVLATSLEFAAVRDPVHAGDAGDGSTVRIALSRG